MTGMSRTDSETLRDVMIVMTAVEIASVVEIALMTETERIATMTEVAETMIVEVCSISSMGFTLLNFSYDSQNECEC